MREKRERKEKTRQKKETKEGGVEKGEGRAEHPAGLEEDVAEGGAEEEKPG